jgi:hypothetical protein
MTYNKSDFSIYARLTEKKQHVMGYIHRDGEVVIPDCIRTVKSELGINKENKIVAFGLAKINGEVIALVKPDGAKFWHISFA